MRAVAEDKGIATAFAVVMTGTDPASAGRCDESLSRERDRKDRQRLPWLVGLD